MVRVYGFSTAALALAAAFAGCVQDDSAPNRLGMERPALLPVSSQNQEDADKRAIEKPQRAVPTAGSEFPGQSSAGKAAGMPDGIVTLDDLASPQTAPSTQAATMASDIGPATSRGPVVGYDIDDNKDQATPGRDIPVPGTTSVIDKTWGQVYPLPEYPHRDWAPSVAIYQTGGVPGNPWYFNPIWGRPDYQPNHPYGQFGAINADLLEIPYFFAQLVALPVLVVMDNPLNQKTTNNPTGDPNYRLYIPDGPIVPGPYPGTFQFEPTSQPAPLPADQQLISRELPGVPIKE